MLRKSTDEDISNEELETIINPFYDNCHNYVEKYVMPEVIAFYFSFAFSCFLLQLLFFLYISMHQE